MPQTRRASWGGATTLKNFNAEEEEKRKAAEAFPKVAGLKLRESIEIIVGELDKLGVSEESDLEFLPDNSFEKLSLTPVSQAKIKKLATTMRESPPAVVQPEPAASAWNQSPAAFARPK